MEGDLKEQEKAAFDAAQAEHERLQTAAREHWELTGEELSTGPHYGGCWCCCWDDPCESTPMPGVPLD